eukprot:2465105-Prymnesium_polylepis.1
MVWRARAARACARRIARELQGLAPLQWWGGRVGHARACAAHPRSGMEWTPGLWRGSTMAWHACARGARMEWHACGAHMEWHACGTRMEYTHGMACVQRTHGHGMRAAHARTWHACGTRMEHTHGMACERRTHGHGLPRGWRGFGVARRGAPMRAWSGLRGGCTRPPPRRPRTAPMRCSWPGPA